MLQLPKRGWSKEVIERGLQENRSGDMPVHGGRVWAYVYPAGEEIEAIQKRAYLEFLSENALDPTVFPSLRKMENDVVAIALSHMNAPEGAAGNFTSGGTESCMLAVKTARDYARKVRGIAEPQIVVPVTAHAAFHKAAQYFDVELVTVPVDEITYKVRPEAVEAALTDRTALVVVSAPSYAHGVIDPVTEIAALAKARGILCHVDGCIGAWLLPFFEKLGATVTPFDFRVDGVTSLSMDLHKYGFCPKGASVILYRSKELRKFQVFSCAAWTGYSVVNPTMLSTKTGGPVAAAWATLHALGEEGYLQKAAMMREATQKLIAGIAEIPSLAVLGTPEMTLVAFSSSEVSPFFVIDAMKKRNWYIQPQFDGHGSRANIHLTITPQSLANVEPFLADLRAAVEEVRGRTFGPLVATLGAALDGVDPTTFGDEMLGQMLAMGGLSPDALPEEMADVNAILNALPPALTEKLLATFVNDLFTPTA